jgi:hypothetical protein
VTDFDMNFLYTWKSMGEGLICNEKIHLCGEPTYVNTKYPM